MQGFICKSKGKEGYMRNRASKPARWASKGRSKIIIQELEKGKEMAKK